MSEDLVPLAVPQCLVDLSKWNLSGSNKENVLRYLDLEDTLGRQGILKVDERCAENIPLGPVRDYFLKKLSGKEYSVNFAERELPITFRTYLAVGVLTTSVVDYLKEREEVELYGSREAEAILNKISHSIKRNELNKIRFVDLPKDTQRDLILPIINDYSGARAVVYAGFLFPDGIEVKKILPFEPSIRMRTIQGIDFDDVVYFKDPENLGIKSELAGICICNYLPMKRLNLADFDKKPVKKGETLDDEPEEDDSCCSAETQRKYERYPEGTKLYKIFPFREGETKEDLHGSYNAKYGYSGVTLPYEDKGSYAYLVLKEDDTLEMVHEIKNFLEHIATQHIDALSGKYTMIYHDRSDGEEDKGGVLGDEAFLEGIRGGGVEMIIGSIRNDMDDSHRAIDKAKQKRGTTNFIVEKNLLGVLESIEPREITRSELENYLADLKQNMIYVPKVQEDRSGNLPDRITGLTDKDALNMDYRILSAIKHGFEEKEADPFDFFSIFKEKRDGLADWLGYSNHLLSEYSSVILDSTKLFEILGIPPTDDTARIHSAYRKSLMKYHPDRNTTATIEELSKTVETTIKIAEAYTTINDRLNKKGINATSPVYNLGRISGLFERDSIG